MAIDLDKVTYVDGTTVVYANNLNQIQQAILDLEDNKVEAETGKGLSTNDYTTAEQQKLAGVNNVANLVYVVVTE